MFKTIAVIASTAIFTILGIIVGLGIMWTRPADFTDSTGLVTVWTVVLPTLGGSALGLFVASIATGQVSADKTSRSE